MANWIQMSDTFVSTLLAEVVEPLKKVIWRRRVGEKARELESVTEASLPCWGRQNSDDHLIV